MNSKLPAQDLLFRLEDAARAPIQEGRASGQIFHRGTLDLRHYKPVNVDLQQPHAQDELYFICSGHGNFFRDGATVPCKTGDALFVAAGVEHRFVDFSSDFAVWVVFYGPEGGERP